MKTKFENIGWTLGNHCNAKCEHCYSWQLRADSKEFLSKLEVDTIVDQLANLGVKTVNLGGNEPIYTNGSNISNTILPYIISALRKKGFLVGLTTNSVSFIYLSRHYPEELAMINDIDFSLDAPDAFSHDSNRKVKLFDTTLEAIKDCRKMGIDCSIVTCGMKSNFDEATLSKFLSLSAKLDCEFRVNTLKPVEPHMLQNMPSARNFYEGFEHILNHTDCVVPGESCVSSLIGTGASGCPCGTYSFRINAKDKTGRVSISPCVYLHDFRVGDLLSQDIFEILESDKFKSFTSRKDNLPPECNPDCNFFEHCQGGCAARSYLTKGDLNAKDPYCPADYFKNTPMISLPETFSVNSNNDVRVHDNYLCTWIAKPNKGV